jgi:V/A-type H+-transporting ATPase subunit F
VVITDPETADGFRLAGVEVQACDSSEVAVERLAALLDDESAGIIVINEGLAASIDSRLQKKIDSLYRPIVISLPIREKLELGEDHHAYLARLIRRAIGFDIALRRG